MRLSTCKASKFTLFCHRFLGCICYLFPAAGNKCPAFLLWAIPHNSKCRYGERGAADAKPKAQIILESYRAFWQRRCRAAAAGAVLKPQGGNCAVLPVFTPDCVSFCEVSSHAANSKGRRLRFLGSHRRIVMLFYLILFAPDSFRNLFNQLELVPLLQPGQLVADLAGDKTTLRAQAEAVHFSASWMRAITVSLCRKRPNFEQRGCFHQRAGPWCAGRLPGSASGQCGFMRRDWCRCPGRPCAGWHPAVWRYFRQCGCRCRRLSGWSACF